MRSLLDRFAEYREHTEKRADAKLETPLTARERIGILGFIGWLARTRPEYEAAPDLLAALENLVACAESDVMGAAIRRAETAIAKAKGES